MADTPLLLREQQYHQIKAVLARLRMDSSARVVFLVDKDGQEIAAQVLRIFDDAGQQQPGIAVGFVGAREIFGECGARAVGDAVFAQIAGTQVSGGHLQ